MDFPYSNLDYSSLSRLSMVNPVLGSPLLPSQGEQLFHSKSSDHSLAPSFLPYRPSSTTGEASMAATSYAAYENLYKAYQNAYGSSAAASIFSQQAYRFDPSQVSTIEAQQQLLLQASLLQYPQLSMYPTSALYPSFPSSLAPPSSNSPASIGPNVTSNLGNASLGSQLSRFQSDYFGSNIAPSLSSLSSKYAHATGLDLVGGQSWINEKRSMQTEVETKDQDQRWRNQSSLQLNESKRSLNQSTNSSRSSENKRGEDSASKRSDNRRDESSRKNEKSKNELSSASQASRDNQKRNNDIKDQSNYYHNHVSSYAKEQTNQYSSHSKVNHASSYPKDQSNSFSNSNINHVSAYNKESQLYSNTTMNHISGAHTQKNDDKLRIQNTEPIMRYSNEYLDSMSRLFASTLHNQTAAPEPLNLQKSNANTILHHQHSTLKPKADCTKKSDLDQLRRYAQKSRQEAKQHEMRFHRPFEPKDSKLNYEKLSKPSSDSSKVSSKSNKSLNNMETNNYSTNHIGTSNIFTNNLIVDKTYPESTKNYRSNSQTDGGVTQASHRINNISKAINMSTDLKNISKNYLQCNANASIILDDVPLNLAKVGFIQNSKDFSTIETNNVKPLISLLEWEHKIGEGHRVEISEKWLKKQIRCLAIETNLKRKSNFLNKKKIEFLSLFSLVTNQQSREMNFDDRQCKRRRLHQPTTSPTILDNLETIAKDTQKFLINDSNQSSQLANETKLTKEFLTIYNDNMHDIKNAFNLNDDDCCYNDKNCCHNEGLSKEQLMSALGMRSILEIKEIDSNVLTKQRNTNTPLELSLPSHPHSSSLLTPPISSHFKTSTPARTKNLQSTHLNEEFVAYKWPGVEAVTDSYTKYVIEQEIVKNKEKEKQMNLREDQTQLQQKIENLQQELQNLYDIQEDLDSHRTAIQQSIDLLKIFINNSF